MEPLDHARPEQFILDFFTSFTEQVVRSDADPGPVLDRYYTADIVQVSDGVRLDRDKLVAHIRPVRRNLVDYRYEVHEAVASGDRIAARLTIHAEMRKGPAVVTEVHLFGQLAPDGRFRRTHQLTRRVPA